MKAIAFFGLFFGILATGQDNFEHRYRDYLDGVVRAPAPERHQKLNLHYVFVGGFLNEVKVKYFQENIAHLAKLGIPLHSIHVLLPSSVQSIDDGSESLALAFVKIPGRLVIVAHSKGAAETLAFTIKHARWVRQNVEAIFLVQGTFGGSPIADYLLGKGIELDQRMPLKERLFFVYFSKASPVWTSRVSGGLSSLGTEASKQYWEKLLPLHRDEIPLVNDRIFFIRATKPPAKTASLVQPFAHFLQSYFGNNDGLVRIEDQTLKGIGTELADLEADHTEFFIPRPFSGAPEIVREAFTKSIFTKVETTNPPRGCDKCPSADR